MSYLDSFLKGELDANIFIGYLHSSETLQNEILDLIPADAVDSPQHALWKCFPYNAIKQDSFDLLHHLNRICYYNGRMGDNLNLFGILKSFYSFHYPDFPFTNRFLDEFYLYLYAVQDCFDGPEVNMLVTQVIEDCVLISQKTKRKKEAKERIKSLFHVENSSRPRWIQGPEWPMGKNSPMKYERRERKGELLQFYFSDVDTGETKIVEQIY